jgi:hypothetical protein
MRVKTYTFGKGFLDEMMNPKADISNLLSRFGPVWVYYASEITISFLLKSLEDIPSQVMTVEKQRSADHFQERHNTSMRK